jgi:hypothetical protein
MEDGSGGAEPTLEIVDRVLIPAGTPPGDYSPGRHCHSTLPLAVIP